MRMKDNRGSVSSSTNEYRISVAAEGWTSFGGPVESAFAWVSQRRTEHREDLQNVDVGIARYRAVLHALGQVARGATVHVFTDSVHARELRGERPVKEHKVAALRKEVWALISERKLHVNFGWVGREDNPAHELLMADADY